MKIGKLRHWITIQSYTPTRDSFGAEVEHWQDVMKVWASVEPLTGKEYFAAQEVNAEVSVKVIMRYSPGIQPEMRVIFGARVFEILAVMNTEERNKQLILLCKEVLNDG